MLRAHSLLWRYLWLAPQVLLVGLAVLLWRRGFHKLFPIFFAYTLFQAVEELTLYTMDAIPSVTAEAWWKAFWIGLIIEGALKFAVVAELLRHLLRSRPALARMGSRLFVCTAAGLALSAGVVAAFTPPYNPHWLVGGAQLLLQTLYIIQCGLILLLFMFAAFFKLAWDRLTFGIALGFGLIFSERLAAWALVVGGSLADRGYLVDFLNMATYHVCVLIWFYYLLVPQKKPTTSAVSLPDNNLAIWNRELERLLR
jgi:hypothetical protein